MEREGKGESREGEGKAECQRQGQGRGVRQKLNETEKREIVTHRENVQHKFLAVSDDMQ